MSETFEDPTPVGTPFDPSKPGFTVPGPDYVEPDDAVAEEPDETEEQPV